VGQLGALATPELLADLTGLLRDQDGFVRGKAAEAVGELGAAAATPEVLADLAGLLREKDEFVQEAAANGVGGLGAAAATPEILAGLLGLLRDPQVQVGAANAIAELFSQGLRIFGDDRQLQIQRVEDLARECGP
jgi:HEAT repeat protein